jgi:tRNA(fMet)-specific endonuclease VapC
VILLDTDICVELLRGNPQVVRRLQQSAGEVAISFMTVGELFYGVERSDQPQQNRGALERFLLSVVCLNAGRDVMEKFGTLKASLARRGEILPDADLLVAATALTRCDLLVTGNTGHFARIAGLKVADWTQ